MYKWIIFKPFCKTTNHVTNLYCLLCQQGSRDNMSIVLVALPAAPKVSAEAQAKEKELEAQLEKRIAELVEQNEGISFQQLIRTMLEQDIPNLPPGGGLSSK